MGLLDSTACVVPILCTGLFSGVHLCIRYSLVPAMLALDDSNALRYFSHMYPPLAILQPALIGIAALASTLRLTLTAVPSSLAANCHFLVIVHLLYVLGYTFAVMLTDNNNLLQEAESKEQATKKGGRDIRTMLVSWGARNEARVWPGLVLFVMLVVAETGQH